MTFYDEDESPIESRDEHVATFGVDDDPAEEEAVDPLAEAHIAAMAAAMRQPEPEPSPRSSIPLGELLAPAMQRIDLLAAQVQRLGERLERLEADLGVEDEFGDRPLPLDTPDIATVSRGAVISGSAGEAALSTVSVFQTPPDEPLSLDEINRRARAEAEALREQDLAEGQGLAGVPEMVPAPLDDDMTDKPGFR